MYAKGAWLSGNSNGVTFTVTLIDDSQGFSGQDISDVPCDDNGNNLCTNLWVWLPRRHIYKRNHKYHAEINISGYRSSDSHPFSFFVSTQPIVVK